MRGTFRFDPEFELALRLMGEGRIDVKPLISTSLPFDAAVDAFELASDRSKIHEGATDRSKRISPAKARAADRNEVG